MCQPNEQAGVPAGLDIPAADWQQTPPSVQTLSLSLQKRLEALEARLPQDSTPSHRPPSTDSPSTKRRKASEGAAPRRKAGGQPGHPGHRHRLWAPTDPRVLPPPQCLCGHSQLGDTRSDSTHQVLELPTIQRDVPQVVVQQAWCPLYQQWTKAQVPAEPAAGSGPRLTALLGDIAGTHGTSRRTMQTCWASVLQVPLSLGAIQNLLDRVPQAMAPHSAAMAQQARQAPVNYVDETP